MVERIPGHVPRVGVTAKDLSRIDFQKIDVAKAVDSVAVGTHLRKRRSSTIRFVIHGVAVLGLAFFAILDIPGLRARLESVTRSIRARVDEWRGSEA